MVLGSFGNPDCSDSLNDVNRITLCIMSNLNLTEAQNSFKSDEVACGCLIGLVGASYGELVYILRWNSDWVSSPVYQPVLVVGNPVWNWF